MLSRGSLALISSVVAITHRCRIAQTIADAVSSVGAGSPWWSRGVGRPVADQMADALQLHAAAKALLHRHRAVGTATDAQFELATTAFTAHGASIVTSFMTA